MPGGGGIPLPCGAPNPNPAGPLTIFDVNIFDFFDINIFYVGTPYAIIYTYGIFINLKIFFQTTVQQISELRLKISEALKTIYEMKKRKLFL